MLRWPGLRTLVLPMCMIARNRSLPHGQVPNFFYGTAWKEDATAALVTQAITAGFRGIDTANQRKHYHEAGVGQAVQAALTSGQVRRAELFLQSKFTFRDGQDHRLPYDPSAAIAKQVTQSFASSCEHLGVEYLDSLVLHGPSQSGTLGAADHEAWRAMEQLVLAGNVGVIGISNVAAPQLRELLQFARVAPTFVQNRCYASRGWDAEIRAICAEANVVYQGFSLLTANRAVIASSAVQACAQHHGRSAEQIVFRFALQAGMLPLTGSTDMSHLRADLACFDFELTAAETDAVATAAVARSQ